MGDFSIVEEFTKIGENTKIWNFTHIRVSAHIGDNCNIGNNVFIGERVQIGDNVRIANSVNVYDGVIIKDNVIIGPAVTFTNVKYPRHYRTGERETTLVEENVTIKANAVIMAGIKIGRNSTIGEGAIVIRDVSEGGFVISPAAECICNQDTCKECIGRKQKKLEKHLNYVARKAKS